MSDTITPDRLRSILCQARPLAESTLYHRLRVLDDTSRFSHAEIGLICHQVEAHELWRERSASFAAWVRDACPWGYSTAFAAMRDVDSLQDMPIEAVAKIPAGNFSVMKQLSTAVRNDPQVIRAAQTQSSAELREMVRTAHPDQHIEATRVLRFTLEESAAERVEEVIRGAQLRGAKTWGEALELIAEEASDVWRIEAEVMESIARSEEVN